MNHRVQLALVIIAAIALPALSRAGDTETIAKRTALGFAAWTRLIRTM